MATTTIPLGEVKQWYQADWIDCTIGGVFCPCGGYVGQLDIHGDPQRCQKCERVFRLVVSVEVGDPA